MKLVYPAIFTPCLEKEGYTVIVPDLPGCITEGNTLTDAIKMGTDAASGWILDELQRGNPIPSDTDYKNVLLEYDNSFVNLLILDMESYTYPAIFTEEENNQFSVVFPDLEGCYTCGDSLEDALEMAEDALALILYGYKVDNKAFPAPSKGSELSIPEDSFISIVTCTTVTGSV